VNTNTTIEVSDGSTMRAYVARPSASGKSPALLIFQEAFGVNAHIRSVADRFAAEGYVALAPELFHRASPGFEGDYGNFNSVRPMVEALTDAGLEADIYASFDWLSRDASVDPHRIGSIGFCLGGRASFLANAIVPLKGAVSFYGGNIAQTLTHLAPQLHGAALMFWGGQDKRILPEHIRAVVDALRAAKKPYTNIEFSEAEHGFFCDARSSYHRESAEQAWHIVLRFLKTHLNG
jgi:carboxymethylenebutenolidase